MKNELYCTVRPIAAAILTLSSLLAAPAQAVTYTLVAAEIDLALNPAATVMPDGTAGVRMWGYRVCAGTVTDIVCNNSGAPLTSPGAALVVPPNDNTLQVTLYNQLRLVPTSFVVHGLNTAMAPVFADAVGTVCTPSTTALPPTATPADEAARRACRLRSFTTEAAPPPQTGVSPPAIYTYNNVRPGTYLYQSGTLPQIQVQMGLYGMMSKDAGTAGTVYPGVTYDAQTRMIFSEVDAAMHASIYSGTLTGSTLDYNPRHFRTHIYDPLSNLPVQVNASSAAQFMGGPTHLIRMANAGLQTRVPALNNGTWALLGEDAQPYPYAREQHTALLPAAKTSEAFLNAARPLTMFDRRMAFADVGSGGVAGQFVQFSTAVVVPASLTHNCSTTGVQGTLYTCTATSEVGATLSLVSPPAGMTISGGVITWTPTNAQAQLPANPTFTNPVQIVATAPGFGATTASFSVAVTNVNDAPTAVANTYTFAATATSRTLTVAAPGVLAGDSDIDGDTLTAQLVTPPADGTPAPLNADGSISYTLPATATLPATRTFTYRAVDPSTAVSNTVTVTMNFTVAPPVAVADTYTFNNTILFPTQTIPILANDTPGGLAFNLTNVQVARESNGAGATTGTLLPNLTRGTVATPSTGAITYAAPLGLAGTTNNAGTDYFYYRVRNTAGTFSAWTRVDVTMN